jgi:hypothetical protein
MDRRLLLAGLIATALGAQPASADVKIGVKITAPVPPLPVVVVPAPVVVAPAPQPPVVVAPAPVVVAPPPPPRVGPQVVIIPGSGVHYVPGVDFNMFVYEGHYYSFHHGTWFRASRHSGRWKAVDVRHVPRPVRHVPVEYYRVPPGHARRIDGPPPHVREGRPGPPPWAGRGDHGPDRGKRGRD